MEPRRLAFVFRSISSGIQCRVASEAEWLAWTQREEITPAEFEHVRGLTLAQIDAALEPLRAPKAGDFPP